ncbi:unnamed protein product [Rotaria sordida]|uniref:EF-hand domain-containing protein n=2 Tax=Rotaria sordida TaxID=392033 RepID=A0A814Z961_9BILA|nr:unnamed protein product [Rotaria sordida]CAF1240503.1 unnamed protein product [Rotaria sordida]CAF4017725.1 unnamed protein product [Rotaria sordida]CAF4040265.1 unnamed protein product [Rotaria sordida]
MARCDATEDVFEQIDTNRDGRIDKNEYRKWASNTEGLPSSSYESSTSRFNLYDNTTSRFDRDRYRFGSRYASENTTDRYGSYENTALPSDLTSEAAIQTNSSAETDAYLEKSAHNIYRDPNPQIIRRATTGTPVTYEQRVVIRYLQPPTVPEPGPLIIKEVRPAQPPPPRPLIIRENASSVCSPPPLILRERPPTPPSSIPSETVTRCLPPIPAPPRSVVIERYPSLPPKPRDIIIERWIPYGPPSERRRVVEPAPPPITYPEPRNTVIIYENVETRTARKFEKLGVAQENPADYVARYGASLLDPRTLVQQARSAGVIEDISPPVGSSSMYTNIRGNTVDFDRSNEIINRDYSLPRVTSYERMPLAAGAQACNLGKISYSSSASNLVGDRALVSSACTPQRTFSGCDSSLAATDSNCYGQAKQTEFEQYI